MSEITTVRVRCLNPPVTNRKQNITLWHEGDESNVPLDGFWKGQIGRNNVKIVEDIAEVTTPEPGQIYIIGQGDKEKVVTIVAITEKAYVVTAEGAKKPWPIAKSKWGGKAVESTVLAE